MLNKYEIRKKNNSTLWGVYERMGNAFVSHSVEVYHAGYDACVAFVKARR